MNKEKDGILLISTGYSPANEMDSGRGQLQLGQLYLATILTKKGYRIKLYSDLFPDPNELLSMIKEENFSIVGFYSTTNTIYRVKALIKFIKNAFPHIIIFLGGPHPTVEDKKTLLQTEGDLIMRHEGEYTFQEVLDYYFEHKGTLEDIKGITFKKNGEIIRTENREFIINLDELPIPDWHLLKGDSGEINHKYPSIITGRGCPFKCAFCFEGFGGNLYRLRSAENVIKEIDLLLNNWDVKYIKFVDDTFVVNSKRVQQICSHLLKRKKKKNFYWFCEARVDILNKRLNLLNHMKEAGLAVLQIGVESGNQHILDLYDKKISLEEIENVVKACVKENIFCISVNVILGGPYENKTTLKNTAEFIKKLIKIGPGRVFCQTSLLTPYPSTPIGEKPENFGLKTIDPLLLGGQTEETCFMESEELDRVSIYRERINFEIDIYETMIKEAKNMTAKQIEEHIHLTDYGIKTPWYDIVTENQGIKRYFNFKRHNLYKTFKELKEKEILHFCPVRTFPLEYRGNNLILKTISDIIELQEEENLIYEYSSGKLSFSEIIIILKEKTSLNENILKEKMLNFYRKMDNYYGIIFSSI